MEYNSIYKNGKPERFFIKVDNLKEFQAFLHPYYIVTSIEHPRKGSIKEMDCLYSGLIWQGKQTHGYGYSSYADVYNTLIDIILQLYKKQLTAAEIDEIKQLDTHDNILKLSDGLTAHLIALNDKKLYGEEA